MLAFIMSTKGYADSPITSTTFYSAYKDLKMVKYALEIKNIDTKIAKYLTSKRVRLDHKAAVINAISWDTKFHEKAKTFMEYVMTVMPKHAADTTNQSCRDIYFCYAYLMCMDDYFDVKEPYLILQKLKKYYPDDYTAQMITALVSAQYNLDNDWCICWREVEKVENNFIKKVNMRADARKVIMDYMMLYKEYCDK